MYTQFQFFRPALIAACLSAPMAVASNAQAFGDACKTVNFSVDNDYNSSVTVTSVDLYSDSEGRWLSNNIPNIEVPKGARDFVLYKGENIEHGENDRISKMRLHYYYWVWAIDDNGNGGGNDTSKRYKVERCSTDNTIDEPVCVANRWFKGTIHARPGNC